MITAIVADDLTGACDTAIAIRSGNEKIHISLRNDLSGLRKEGGVWGMSTNTRACTEEGAYASVFDSVAALRGCGGVRLFKKVDSVFRGNTAAEVEAAARAWNARVVLAAPATPIHGRTIRDGRLRVQGLEQDGMQLPELLKWPDAPEYALIGIETVRRGAQALRAAIESEERGGKTRLLIDGETEEDLLLTAEAVGDWGADVLLVGTSGLASAIAETRRRREGTAEEKPILPQCAPPVLLILGSCHSITKTQCSRFLGRPGTAAVWINAEKCVCGEAEREEREALKKCRSKLQSGVNALVVAVDSLKEDACIYSEESGVNGEISNEDIVEALAHIVNGLLEEFRIGALILSGGDTARQILAESGASHMELLCELLSGVPLGHTVCRNGQELLVVTKSGGFGEPQAFQQILALIEKPKSYEEVV